MNTRQTALTALILVLSIPTIERADGQQRPRPGPQTGEGRTIILYRLRLLAGGLSELRSYAERAADAASSRPDGTIREIKNTLTSLKSEAGRAGFPADVVTTFQQTIRTAQKALEKFAHARTAQIESTALAELTESIERMQTVVDEVIAG